MFGISCFIFFENVVFHIGGFPLHLSDSSCIGRGRYVSRVMRFFFRFSIEVLIKLNPLQANIKGRGSSNENCSMTFCFSFDVLIKLNPIQVNIEGGGPS